MDTKTINKGKQRWHNREMLLKINIQTESLKKVGGNSVPQAPVNTVDKIIQWTFCTKMAIYK
jgi:hypothetical protein